MTRDDVDLAVQWAADEGWNPGLHDADCFHAADPRGFFVAELAGEPIGCVSGVAYGDAYGFVGFYIVRPEQRGRGYGIRLWHAAMARLDGRTVGLDGVVEQQETYKRSGFQPAFRSVRHQGAGVGVRPAPAGVVSLADVPLADILAYDQARFLFPRPEFLQRWISRPGSAALGLVRDGRLAGYGVIRPCRSGHKIGPLFADAESDAEALFCALAAQPAPGGPVFLDTPEANPAAVALARRHGMAPVFETARMYRGPAPDLPLASWFGVTSFELG